MTETSEIDWAVVGADVTEALAELRRLIDWAEANGCEVELVGVTREIVGEIEETLRLIVEA